VTSIYEFRITNLAGRRGEVHRILNPKLNIFWGLNGSGKTTLLRILDAALSNRTQSIKNLPFDKAEVTFYSNSRNAFYTRIYDKSGSRQAFNGWNEGWATYVDPDTEEEITYRVGEAAEDRGWITTPLQGAPEDGLAVNYKHSYLPISRMLDPRRNERPRSQSADDDRFAQRVNQVWSTYSQKSLAEVRDVQQFGLADVLGILFGGRPQLPAIEGLAVDEMAVETAATDAYKIVSSFLADQRILLPLGEPDFTARYEESILHRHVVTRIRSIMRLVDQILAPTRELEAVIEEMYMGKKHLVLNRGAKTGNVAVRIDSESVPLDALSSGEKQVLQLLLETLAVEESTIMIDEPELSLHPDWQKRLVGSMRRVNADAQFLLATHSPELMIGVPDECVFEL
jgi:predicted ATPase